MQWAAGPREAAQRGQLPGRARQRQPNDNTIGTSVVQAAIALPTSATSQGSGDPALSQCALSPPPVELCFNLSTANGSGTVADATFLVVMY
jgi:hypothetical protein